MVVAEICRKGGFSDATFYKWRAKFGGMEASDFDDDVDDGAADDSLGPLGGQGCV